MYDFNSILGVLWIREKSNCVMGNSIWKCWNLNTEKYSVWDAWKEINLKVARMHFQCSDQVIYI